MPCWTIPRGKRVLPTPSALREVREIYRRYWGERGFPTRALDVLGPLYAAIDRLPGWWARKGYIALNLLSQRFRLQE
jgi:hypothetical protein